MRLTPALYVRHLLSKLHPPLPRSPKESQQLLNVLEGSFRKHLDQVHPSPTARNESSDGSLQIPITSPHSASNATLYYFNALLTHPLLEKREGRERGHAGDSQVQSVVENFQQALIRGEVSVALLEECVSIYQKALRGYLTQDHGSKLAPLLAAWMHSATVDVKQSALTAPGLIGRMVNVMVADQDERTVWEWLQLIYERDPGFVSESVKITDRTWLRIEDALVSSLMDVAIRRRNIPEAAQQFAEACRYRSASGRGITSTRDTSDLTNYTPMNASWKRLAASIIFFRKQHGISADLYNTVLSYGTSWTEAPIMSEPFLNIYHPSTPSAELLCMHLRNAQSAAIFIDGGKNISKSRRRATLVALLDAAQLSLDQKMTRDARFILEMSSDLFSDILPRFQVASQQSLEMQLMQLWERLDTKRTGIPILTTV